MYPNQSVANNGVHAGGTPMSPTQQQNMNYNGLQQQRGPQQGQQQPTKSKGKKAYVKITEQPAGKALRFRYECEGRSAGSIPGVNSTPENKTYPAIEIVGYKGRAVVVVSCVTKDPPYRPHPHNLVGKEGCKKGVCTVEINSETMRAVFSNLGIQCVKKKDIDAALKAREDIRVDPFKTGFEHRCQPSSIDLNSVRLCFQVFLENEQNGRFTNPLTPVISEPIYDKKAMSDLAINRLCTCSATVLGNTQIFLWCEKVAKDDIMVRFFEEKDGKTTWESFGDFQQTDVYKQVSIAFKTPRYHKLDITEPAKVFIQLRRPSDGVTSEPLPFEYIPLDSDPVNLRRKRQKIHDDTRYALQQEHIQHRPNTSHTDHTDGRQTNMTPWNTLLPSIKTEPREPSPQSYNTYRNPSEMAASPQPLSPSNAYAQNSPAVQYNLMPTAMVTTGTGMPSIQAQLMSRNRQFHGGGLDGTTNENNATPMSIQNCYSPQHQPQQTIHHQQQQQQQQFQQQIYDGATNWAVGGGNQANDTNPNANNHLRNLTNSNAFNMQMMNVSSAGGSTPVHNSNASNLNQTHPFVMHNLIPDTSSAVNGAPTAIAVQPSWNIPPGNLHEQQMLQQQHQQQYMEQQQQQYQHQHQPPTPTNMHDTQNNNQNATPATASDPDGMVNNNEENGPTVSNLLTFDSGQLLPLGPEEDLQISNLSISSKILET